VNSGGAEEEAEATTAVGFVVAAVAVAASAMARVQQALVGASSKRALWDGQ